jgi:hypothetical protein
LPSPAPSLPRIYEPERSCRLAATGAFETATETAKQPIDAPGQIRVRVGAKVLSDKAVEMFLDFRKQLEEEPVHRRINCFGGATSVFGIENLNRVVAEGRHRLDEQVDIVVVRRLILGSTCLADAILSCHEPPSFA